MVNVHYKDIVILLLVVSQILLIFQIISKTDDNTCEDNYLSSGDSSGDNVKGHIVLRDTGINNSINISEVHISILDNRSEHREVNDSNDTKEMDSRSSYNETYNNNTWYPTKNISTVKNISLNKLFLDLPYYSKVISISEKGNEGIIKIYEKDGRIINFDVRNYKPNLDNPRYVNVSKERKSFKYGIYYKYIYTVQYDNIISVDYCYYREIGGYHIIMGFDKEDEFIKDIWLRWNGYIENII